MSDIITANDLSLSLRKALNLPEHTTEFTLSVKHQELVTITGKFYITKDEIAEFERVFKDKAELV